MACDEIVAEELTITGSIGVVSSKFNAKELNDKIGFGVDAISRGRYAEVTTTLTAVYDANCASYIYYSLLSPLFLSAHLIGPEHFTRLHRGRGHIFR
jgi:Peptidase family S49